MTNIEFAIIVGTSLADNKFIQLNGCQRDIRLAKMYDRTSNNAISNKANKHHRNNMSMDMANNSSAIKQINGYRNAYNPIISM